MAEEPGSDPRAESDFLTDDGPPVGALPPAPDDALGAGARFWHTRAAVISDLVVAHGELIELDGERERARRTRDLALRAARDAGWTYDEIIARIGVSSTTIVNALRRA